jgi:DNA polymerase I-like protein with 3'-5' exonuclease and polymerase domains
MIILWGSKSPSAEYLVGEYLGAHPVTWAFINEGMMPPCKPGDIVLAMGGKALANLQKASLVPKGRAITSTRGKVLEWDKRQFVLTYDPNAIWSDWSTETYIRADLNLIRRLVDTGSADPVLGDYRYADNFNRELQHIKDGERYASIDLETLSLDPFAKEVFIVSIQVTTLVGETTVIRFKSADDPKQPAKRLGNGKWQVVNETLHQQITWLLTSIRVKVNGANLKFDQMWMYEHWGIYCTNQTFDTTIVGSILNENRSNSLNTHAKVYTTIGGYDDPLNDKYDKGRMDLVPDDDFLIYAAGDTDACQRVMIEMREKLVKDKLATRHFTHLVMPATRCFEKMERSGVILDLEYYAQFDSELAEEQDRTQKEGLAIMPGRLRMKHFTKLKLTRAALISDYMFSPKGLGLKPFLVTEKSEQPSTAMEHLQMFSDHPKAGPFIKTLQGYKDIEKTLSTYVRGFMKYVRDDGLLHPSAMMFKGAFEGDSGGEGGTNTGRLSFRDPAMQTLPKHTKWAKALRKGYKAPPGYVCVELDFSQGELRIAACVANEPTMIQSYKDGIDLHAKTGGSLNGYTMKDMDRMKEADDGAKYKLLRQGGKAGNFGLLYGMGAEGFVTYALSTYGVVLQLQQAQVQRDAFFTLYPGLGHWHNQQKSQARQAKRVYSPLGRVRHLPLIASQNGGVRSKAERQSINSPVQSTLSDMALLSLVVFDERYSKDQPTWPDECRCVMMTHDSLTWYVKEDRVDVWVPRIVEIMENLPLESFGWKPQLSFPVDYSMGPNLAEMKEMT